MGTSRDRIPTSAAASRRRRNREARELCVDSANLKTPGGRNLQRPPLWRLYHNNIDTSHIEEDVRAVAVAPVPFLPGHRAFSVFRLNNTRNIIMVLGR